MKELTIKEIGDKIQRAGRLKTRVLSVFGSENPPEQAIPAKKISRCIAQAIFTLSIKNDINSIYVGGDVLEGCCPGGTSWLGFSSFAPGLKFFLSSGTPNYRGGAAEYLVSTPDLAESRMSDLGKISPLGKYIVVQACETIVKEPTKVNALLCFGESEQIRNLCTLAYFGSSDPYDLIKTPMGPSCASFVTFPASMSEKGPKNRAILGPIDPTGNSWFPSMHMALGIPIELARQMSIDLDNSFIAKRANIAYPDKRS